MIYERKEKVKSFVLALLILSSIIQVGILWNTQSRRFPFAFLSGIFDRNDINETTNINERATEEVFLPYRIIISNGNNLHWIVNEEDDGDFYFKLWNEAKGLLKRVINSNNNVNEVNKNLWDVLIVRKGFLFEFKSSIKTDMIRWFFSIPGDSPVQPESVLKVLILPEDDINKNNTIYILSENNLYKCILPFQKNDMSQVEYNKVINQFENDKDAVQYNIIKEIDPENKFPFKISSDVLCVVRGAKYKKLPDIEYSINGKSYNTEEISSIILANEKESYDRYIDKDNTLVFKNASNTYRLYSNGLLEYRYIPGVKDQEKGDIGKSFEKAYTFIERIKNYLMDTDARLNLVDINDDNPGFYEFAFDYTINGYPIYINNDINKGVYNNTIIEKDAFEVNGSNYRNAVLVKVNKNRIIEINWNIINFKKTRNINEYDVYFEDMLNAISEKYDIQEELDRFSIKNITIGYKVDSLYNEKISPAWMIEKLDGSYYSTEMTKKEVE